MNTDIDTEETLTKCVVNTFTKTFTLYSNKGSEKSVECDDTDQFLNVLTYIKNNIREEEIVYLDPI